MSRSKGGRCSWARDNAWSATRRHSSRARWEFPAASTTTSASALPGKPRRSNRRRPECGQPTRCRLGGVQGAVPSQRFEERAVLPRRIGRDPVRSRQDHVDRRHRQQEQERHCWPTEDSAMKSAARWSRSWVRSTAVGSSSSRICRSRRDNPALSALHLPLRVETGGAGQIRTDEWRFCKPLPYHLATAPRLHCLALLSALVTQRFHLSQGPGWRAKPVVVGSST